MAKLVIEKGDPTVFPRFYNFGLIDDFGNARDMNVINVSRFYVRNDIESFVKERGQSISLVRDLLNSLLVNYRDSNTIESVNNKEFLISNNTDYDTTIATTDISMLKKIRRDRIKLGKLKVFNGEPFIVNTMNGYNYKLIDPRLFNTIMLINPNLNHIKEYERLSKNPNYKFIIGVCGKTYDHDCNHKINDIDYLSRRIDNNMAPYNVRRGNDYASILIPNNIRTL